jgi:DNA-binding response OmpR family regulator
VAIVRYQLDDGYSDDVIAALGDSNCVPSPKVVVLLPANAPSLVEARQIEIGADCVQRDPIRSDILLAYLGKYLRKGRVASTPASPTSINFAGATLNTLERTMQLTDRRVSLTPREVMLAESLVDVTGRIVTYETLYSEVLGRKFRGDTSNMRVLLGKLGASIKRLGVALPDYVEVIPKTGYRYRIPTSKSTRQS